MKMAHLPTTDVMDAEIAALCVANPVAVWPEVGSGCVF